MKNRDVYQRDPFEITLLNHGVATVTDALTATSAARCASSSRTSSARASTGAGWSASWSPT